MRRAATPTNRHVVVKKGNIRGLLSYGANNLFPQELAEVVKTSVTARRCHNARSKFIKGNGFLDGVLAKRIVHRSGLTADGLLSVTAKNVSMYNVETYHVNYNALGKIVGIRPIDAELVRLGEPADDGVIYYAAVCNYLGSQLTRSKRKDPVLCHLFDPRPEIVLEQMKASGGINGYNGQIIYKWVREAGDDYYPEPDHFAAIKDMESEAGLSMYDYATVQNGFNIAGIFAYLASRRAKEKGYDPLADPDSIEYQAARLQGPQKGGALMTVAAETPEELEAMKFLSIAGDKLADRYNSTTDRVENRITRGMGVPPALVGINRQNGLAPTDQELVTASRYMFFVVNEWQRAIKETMETVFAHWHGQTAPVDCTIQNLDYFLGVDLKTPAQTPQAN